VDRLQKIEPAVQSAIRDVAVYLGRVYRQEDDNVAKGLDLFVERAPLLVCEQLGVLDAQLLEILQ
jgi:hypothetical protein